MTITLVLGGARSGKSACAERILGDAPAVYVATARPRPGDADWAARIAAHRRRRPTDWVTMETTDIARAIRDADRPVLVDCLTLWLSALLDDAGAWTTSPDTARIEAEVDAGLDQLATALTAASVPVVLVSNEVGSGVVPATLSGALFRDHLGRVNQRVAEVSDRVLLCVAGRALDLPRPERSGEVSSLAWSGVKEAPEKPPGGDDTSPRSDPDPAPDLEAPGGDDTARRSDPEAVEPPDEQARRRTRLLVDGLAKPPGSFGRLEELAVWLAGVQGGCPPRAPERPAVAVFAGDHGIARESSAYPPVVTAAMVATVAAGRAGVNALASANGATVEVVDIAVDCDTMGLAGVPTSVARHKVRRSSGRIDIEDALSPDEAERAYDAGCAVADESIDEGADLLIAGDLGIGNTTPASALVAAVTGLPAGRVTGRGSGIDDVTMAHKTAAVAAAVDRYHLRLDAYPVPATGRPAAMLLLRTLGGADLAAMAGFLARAARRGVPVLLDGLVVTAAGLAAELAEQGSREWWRAGHRSTEPGHGAALSHLGLDPLLDLDLRLGEGTGAVAALPLVRSAAAMTTGMAALTDLDLPAPGTDGGAGQAGAADGAP
ncbi:MAG: nicotinate-nucleotide--dimethylbenzimidazole phosphoribosyltransferase [Propionibacteriales bacterium]|nr:nicotinate-nucleotide--dimethylbenzimidazole phosphoribosyltransferase [Propionibacteriales bacterium]